MNISNTLIDELSAVAQSAADAANRVTLSYFRGRALDTRNKQAGGFDPVTRADREAETAIREVLHELRPDDGILGEEHDNRAGTSGLTWVLDPIDGTRGYMSGTPTWGTLISVGDDAGPILGLIEQPYIGERFMGTPQGAWLERGAARQEIRVADPVPLERATIFTTFPEVGDDGQKAAFHRLARQTQLTRYGMDCYAYALLAAGQIDLVVEAGLASYDIHAPCAVVQAAGGILTDWHGQPAHHGGTALAASCPDLHAAALEILNA